MQTPTLPERVAARYIGTRKLRLIRGNGPFYNVDGTRRTNLDLFTGDELLMPAAEVLGQSYWHDPRNQLPSEYLGVGQVTKKEDEGRTLDEPVVMGYEFQHPREDFELIPDVREATLAANKGRKASEVSNQLKVKPERVTSTSDVVGGGA